MAKDLGAHGKAVNVANIVHHGEKMILPERMSLDGAIDLLQRRKKYMEEEVTVAETFDVFPLDGAHAFDIVLTRKYGWTPAEATPGFFGPQPPKMIGVEVAPGVVKQVPWGRFSLPGVNGTVNCGASMKDGRVVFALNSTIKRTDEETIRGLFAELRKELALNSIYRGKAIKIRFRDDDGDKLAMPEPKFLSVDDVDERMLVYPDAVQAAIETNLFTPIQRVADCKANGIPVKRGVLLGGTFGTGKTLAAKVASKLAVQAGVTYLYVPRADELADAIEFAKLYQDPACVVFCEDIDRVTNGDRSVQMDDILNIIDGIDTKSSNILVVLTTNDLHSINPAMLRPGRLDAVIDVLPPDAPAVQKLLRVYGGDAIAPETDLTDAAALLDGAIPAVIAEVVKRAKLAQLRRQKPGEKVSQLSSDSLAEAALTIQAQVKLLYPDAAEPKPTLDKALTDIVTGAIERVGTQVSELHKRIL